MVRCWPDNAGARSRFFRHDLRNRPGNMPRFSNAVGRAYQNPLVAFNIRGEGLKDWGGLEREKGKPINRPEVCEGFPLF